MVRLSEKCHAFKKNHSLNEFLLEMCLGQHQELPKAVLSRQKGGGQPLEVRLELHTDGDDVVPRQQEEEDRLGPGHRMH